MYDDLANAYVLASDARVDTLFGADTRFPQTQCSYRFTATRMRTAMRGARARAARLGIGTNACIDTDASARAKKNRCADATTRAKFRAMNTSPHALDATSTCASTHRARRTLAHDAMRMSVDDESMERARIDPCMRRAASRMPRIVRNRMCRLRP
ncbi:hypothetical protein [Ralstonia solanacearum]|uniref:hypothetical protein n=1 Tax=Ralstonia solanacearum TaxID=305 RepID=UPI00186751AF|nr:hypothetical protein [Ralstonia solanacearum]QOK81341.1 hypothetical protein HF906_03730 [Ralstonia solanacearum]